MNLKKYLPPIVFLFLLQIGCAQIPAERPPLKNGQFDKKLTQMLRFSVPIIGVEELYNIQNEVHIFDTREWSEYQVSHIKGAQYLGYDQFDATRLQELPKDTKIVLYCSVGYRSEKIGERLQKMGYTNVYNLYGSIFEWANQGKEMLDSQGQPTKQLHTYNKNWSRWVEPGKAEKIW